MIRFILGIFALLLSGCAVIGSKEVLVINDDSSWQPVQNASQSSYQLKCEKVSLKINEVVFNTKTEAFGPIIPVIPSGNGQYNSQQNLVLSLLILGEIKSHNYNESDFLLSVLSSDSPIKPVSAALNKRSAKPFKTPNDLWVNYQLIFHFEQKLATINTLSLDLKLPFEGCKVPTLHLHRAKISNNEFILSMGP